MPPPPIATPTSRSFAPRSDIAWDPIRSIEAGRTERVYDLEVEGTHNFIANRIVAHNTFLGGVPQTAHVQALMDTLPDRGSTQRVQPEAPTASEAGTADEADSRRGAEGPVLVAATLSHLNAAEQV